MTVSALRPGSLLANRPWTTRSHAGAVAGEGLWSRWIVSKRTDATEELLLPSVAAGDPEAVRRCIHAYGRLVWALARRHCADPADADDAVQEIFIELWKHAGRFDPARAQEKTFVATLARRRLIDRYRRRQRRPGVSSLEPEALEAAAADPSLGPDVRRVLARMEELSPEQRQVLALSAGHGLSHAEIAERTGLPLGTVKSHARRGLVRLRALLEEPR